MGSVVDAKAAVSFYHRVSVDGRRLIVKEADPRKISVSKKEGEEQWEQWYQEVKGIKGSELEEEAGEWKMDGKEIEQTREETK
jgi:hypothetical protein